MNKKITLALLATLVCAMQLLAAPGKIRNASITQDASCTGPGNPNEKILQIMLGISGDAVNLKSIDFTLDGTTDLNDYKKVKVYYNGTDPLNRFDERNAEGATLLGEYDPQPGTMTCDLTTDISLSGRFNYFYIVAGVADDAKEGNKLDATVVSLTTDNETYTVQNGAPDGAREVIMLRKLMYAPGDNGSVAYRIPAMVVLPNGNIVTAIDRRWNSEADLANRIDIIARISEDGGYTWSEEYTIAEASDADNGRGDCALVVAANGDIIAAFVGGNSLWNSTEADPISSFISRSTDGGKTWTPIAEGGEGDITSQIWGSKCEGDDIRRQGTAAFFGSGRGLCLSRQTGENASKNGRIMFVTGVRYEGSLYNYTVYSDDNGHTWKVSELAFSKGDESKVAELNDGTILMSVRNSNGCRGYAKSTDGGETWTEQGTWSDLNVNACNGDILEYTAIADGYDKNRTLHSLPTNDGSKQRAKISMYLSYDEGQTWELKKQLFSGPSAYSTMVKLPDGTIAVYAEDQPGNVTSCYFMRFTLSWLTDGEDTYTAPSVSVGNVTANDGININSAKGSIEITGNEQTSANIYTTDGMLVRSSELMAGCNTIEVPSGIYIVKAGTTVKKIAVP